MKNRQPKLWSDLPVPAWQIKAIRVWAFVATFASAAYLVTVGHRYLQGYTDTALIGLTLGAVCLVNAISCFSIQTKWSKKSMKDSEGS